DGVHDYSPQRFDPSDVTDTAVVVNRWGGGRYRFCACNAKQRIYAWYPKGGQDPLPLDLMTPSRPWTEQKRSATEARDGRAREDAPPAGWFGQYLAAQQAQQAAQQASQREDARLQMQAMGQAQQNMMQIMNANTANVMQLVTAIITKP